MSFYPRNSQGTQPGGAKAELARRELARRHFVDFARFVWPRYPRARHLDLLAGYLEEVEQYVASGGARGIGRLMVLMPPRYWKSQTCSVLFPAWALGRNPDKRVIITSYAAALATGFSRRVRNMLATDEYRAVFGERAAVDSPVLLADDSRAADEWDLAAPNSGGMTAAGVRGGITGKGAHVLIIDDPVKDREEAESQAIQEQVWDWWQSTAYTRLEEGGACIVIMTRWHVQDLAGRLLEQVATGGSERWTVLPLPAVAEGWSEEERLECPWLPERDLLGRAPGEPLWEEKHDAAELATIQGAMGAYNWNSLYQQRPYARIGGMFHRDWFRVVEEPPAAVARRVRYWDKAATEGGGAFTSGVCLSMTVEGTVYVEHVARGQWSTFQREEEMLRVARMDREHRPGRTIIWHEQEPGSGGLDSARSTNMKLSKAGFEVHFGTATGSKEVRAGPWSSACEAGVVRLVRGGWNEAFIGEHVAFPKGPFKDQVDAAGAGYSKLSRAVQKREARSAQG